MALSSAVGRRKTQPACRVAWAACCTEATTPGVEAKSTMRRLSARSSGVSGANPSVSASSLRAAENWRLSRLRTEKVRHSLSCVGGKEDLASIIPAEDWWRRSDKSSNDDRQTSTTNGTCAPGERRREDEGEEGR